MAKDKDRAVNPAAAQRKLEKQKALKKGKAQVAAQRTERLAHRNPHRLETQISDLHALRESSGGKLSARDQKQLEELERDVARVKKARESLGDQAPVFGRRGGESGGLRGEGRGRGRGRGGVGRVQYGGLGKRGREEDGEEDGEEEEEEESEETDEDVRRIPWPRDTPPPVPRAERRQQQQQQQQQQRSEGTAANREPLGSLRYPDRNTTATEGADRPDTSLPAKPTAPAPVITRTYEAKPQVRDLRKEATQRFVPAAVKRKLDATKGVGGRLLEEEEVEKLEKEGYARSMGVDPAPGIGVAAGDVGGVVGEASRLRAEEEAFQKALGVEMEKDEAMEGRRRKGVQVEEVSDEDL